MASAFACQTGNTHLFVHDLADSEDRIRQRYAINGSPLQIWPLHTGYWPYPFNRYAKAQIYNFAVAAILGFHPTWWRASGRRKVLFVRSRLEFLFWGLMKPYLWWLRDWILIYEAHNLELDTAGDREKRRLRTRHALQNYDLVICTTHSLAQDISALTLGTAKCKVVTLCTGLQRLDQPPVVTLSPTRVVLGYIGTIDLLHGVDELFEAVKLLPKHYVLRLVGWARTDADAHLERWLRDTEVSGRVEIVPPVDYYEVADEIDACDIVLVPAGNTVHSRNYRSPLKLFDYMARGKPIVAANVPSHMELLEDGKNARLYWPGDTEDLAACILSLVEQPRQARAIARMAWEQSVDYTYDVRAKRILELVDEVWEMRRSNEAVQA